MNALRSFHTLSRTLSRSGPTSKLSPNTRDRTAAFIADSLSSASASSFSAPSSPPSSPSFSSADQRVNVAQAGSRMIRASPAAFDSSRRSFKIDHLNPPHEFLPTSLYETPRPLPRPPLLGPPASLARRIDPFHITSTCPLDHALNPHFSLAFINSMGKIKSRAQTGLTWKSQRAVGKMVRRARAMGIIPRWSAVLRSGSIGRYDY